LPSRHWLNRLILMEIEDYRSLLRREYDVLRRKRAGYSWAGFAKKVGLSSTHLNDIMKGRSGLSVAKAKSVASKLNLDRTREMIFCDLVEKERYFKKLWTYS